MLYLLSWIILMIDGRISVNIFVLFYPTWLGFLVMLENLIIVFYNIFSKPLLPAGSCCVYIYH